MKFSTAGDQASLRQQGAGRIISGDDKLSPAATFLSVGVGTGLMYHSFVTIFGKWPGVNWDLRRYPARKVILSKGANFS